jgi:cytochrome P450
MTREQARSWEDQMSAQLAPERRRGERVDLAELWRDPYPTYADLRTNDPVAWVPAANRFLVTRHADIVALERDPDTFSAAEEGSLMIRVMGNTLLRKDGAAHRRERLACEPALRPGTVKSHWMPIFQQIVDELIDDFVAEGEADLFDRFAAPCASRCLGQLLGLYEVDQLDLRNWSQAMMDATGNYGDDPEIWRKAEDATRAIDAALDDAVRHFESHPDQSIISSMMHAADPLSREEISGNVKVIIGGGLNEPRDAIAAALVGLLTNEDQLAQVLADPSLWRAVFEETVRWVAPIGMYPRQTTCDTVLGGTALPKGARIGVVIASGNRDESVFENADAFDINRPKKAHVAFGGGPHFCLGAWAGRVQVAEVALPTLFRRAKNLRLGDEAVRWGGWVFRGPLNMPARWNA